MEVRISLRYINDSSLPPRELNYITYIEKVENPNPFHWEVILKSKELSEVDSAGIPRQGVGMSTER